MSDEPMRALEDAGIVAPDGAELLDDVTGFLRRFVAFPSEAATYAIALWILHAHALDAFESTPRLTLLSPEKGSGKTRTLEVLDLVVPSPMHAVNLSAAALFRQVSNRRPTLLMDEADTYLGLRVAKDHEELRGLVNAGHRRGAVAYRCVGEPAKMQVVEFPAFAAVALAGIGDLPDTIIDRAIVVRMRRRAPHETVESFRLRKVKPQGETLKQRAAKWAIATVEGLSTSEPSMPPGIVDRPADVWEPLIAIADAAGGAWPDRARRACMELNAVRQASDPSLGVQLLSDVRSIFEAEDTDRLSTEDLLGALIDLEESPWGDLRGKPIDARGLARRLRKFEVRPHTIRVNDKTPKGYEVADLHDAWLRYLPPSSTETGQRPQQSNNWRSETTSRGADEIPVALTTATRTGGATESERSTWAVPLVAAVAHIGDRLAGNGCDYCGATPARSVRRREHLGPMCLECTGSYFESFKRTGWEDVS